ncbi:MAG: TolC family protein [Candidatus Zixiibacteriota bacterium]|nr:MAG: TolC family protein [candidate division Zixibacteria bacterium]
MTRIFLRLPLASAIILALLGSTAAAQPQALQLSYEEAWELARAENAQIQQAQAGVDRAAAQVGEAVAGALPQVTANGFYKRNFIIPETEVEFGGETARFQFEKRNLFTGSVELSQPLYVAGRVGKALQIARLYRQASREQVAVSQAQVRLEVTRLYFGTVLARNWEEVARETYEQMLQHVERVETMLQQGMVSEYDLIRSRVQASNFLPEVIAAENARQVAHEALAIALGLPPNQPLELTDGLEAYPDQEFPEGDLYALALERRPELRQLDLQEQIQRKLIIIERHGVLWPNLYLTGGYSQTAQESDFEIGDYFWSRNLYAGLSLTIPLFDGFRARNRAQIAQVDLRLVEIQQNLARKGINLEIVQARSSLEEARKNVAAQEEGVELARKALQIAQVQYANGLATQLEVMDAQLALNQARMNLLNARYALITAQAELVRALGRE